MTALVILLIALVLVVGAIWWARHKSLERQRKQLEDDVAEARRWTERLGGQVLNLVGTTEPAKQALADAAERHSAAVSQLDQADMYREVVVAWRNGAPVKLDEVAKIYDSVENDKIDHWQVMLKVAFTTTSSISRPATSSTMARSAANGVRL